MLFLAEGEKLVANGMFTRADDVMFLHVWELEALGKGESTGLEGSG